MSQTLRRILIAEDDSDLRYLLGECLTPTYDVKLVSSGIDIVEHVRAFDAQVVVLDVSMPAVDGITAVRHLKADPATTDIPVVLLTAKASPATYVPFMMEGVVAVLGKPVDFLKLPERLERLYTLYGPEATQRSAA